MREFHGLSQTTEYHAWESMKARCLNEKNSTYPRYGGRGILVCDRWIDSFKEFLSDVGYCPDKSLTLERIDTNGNYEPGNVKWETYAKQARNRRMQSRNKTGSTGVMLVDKAGVDCYVAFWSNTEGKCKTKTFSTRKYGKDEAFLLAKEYRKDQIEMLNEIGSGYTEDHGR